MWHFFRAVLVALVLANFRPVPAFAHASLLSTSPSAGADLTEAPSAISLTFDEQVRIPGNGIRVIDEQAQTVEIGRPKITKNVLAISVPKLHPGAYVVSWRAVSPDGHPIRGAFTFRVGGTGDQQAVAQVASKLLSTQAGQGAIGLVLAALRTLNFLVLLVLIGLVAFLLLVRGAVNQGDARTRNVARVARWAALVAGLATVALYGPYVSGRSFSSVSNGVLLDDTIHDRVGRAILLRTVLMFVLDTLIVRDLARPNDAAASHRVVGLSGLARRYWQLLVAIGLVLATQLFAGHALVGPLPVISALATLTHLIGAGAWIGGLAVFATVVLRNAAVADDDALAVSARFSRLATYSVIAIVVSGLFASWRQLGGIDATTSTTFGRLVLAKVGLVGVLLIFGVVNRRSIQSAGASGSVRRTLTKLVLLETAVALVVVVVTALLVNAAPGREVVARPITVTVKTDSVLIDTTVEPARRGRNEIHLYALQSDGLPLEIRDMTATAQLPSAGIAPITLRLVRAGTNHFQAINADFPIRGDWRIDVTVRIDEFDEATGSASFTIR